MAHPLVEEITNNFPTQIISKIVGKPTYTAIQAVHHLLMENAVSVPTMLGSDNHSHLALITNLIRYLTISGGVAFLPALNTGPVPVPPHLFMMTVEMEALYMQHKAGLNIFYTCHNTNKALKSKLITVVKDTS
eukprot:15331807-Ditylum_brightwellii.AAC.1